MAKPVFSTASGVSAGAYITDVALKPITVNVSGLASGESVTIHHTSAGYPQMYEGGEAIAITYPDNILKVNGPTRFTYVKAATTGAVTVSISEAENL